MIKNIIPFGKPIIGANECREVIDTLKSGILVHGKITEKFEDHFKKFTKAEDAISVSSCTAGMHLLYFVLGIGPGDEVIVPAQTHLATAHAVELTGAKAVFVDCELKTGNIDVNLISKKINSKTRAIAVVHYLGIPVNLSEVLKLTKKNNLYLIEDCALALGSSYKRKHVGLIGDAGVFSFYPVKHMTTAEGGMIILKNKKYSKKIRLARAFGVDRNYSQRKISGIYNCNSLGFNYRMSEIHAAIGIQQIKKIRKFIKIRKKIFQTMFNAFKKNNFFYVLHSKDKNKNTSYYCLTILFKESFGKYRNLIIRKLTKIGIGCSVYYPHPVPKMNYYKNKYGYKSSSYVNAEKISYNSIALPVGPHLSLNNVNFIIKNILKIFNKEKNEFKK